MNDINNLNFRNNINQLKASTNKAYHCQTSYSARIPAFSPQRLSVNVQTSNANNRNGVLNDIGYSLSAEISDANKEINIVEASMGMNTALNSTSMTSTETDRKSTSLSASPKLKKRGNVYDFNGEPLEIRDVWRDNMAEEMAIIREVVTRYHFIAMDTEFPGVVARPIGSATGSNDFQYQTLRCNVDLLKLIQLGITLTDDDGNFAPNCPCWQFHFQFSLTDDMYSQDSIDMLVRSGIDFKLHESMGIDVLDFGEILMTSGLVLSDKVRWISFHGGYDFGYLLRLLSCKPLPADETNFFNLLRTYFAKSYDIKHIMTALEGQTFKAGLNRLSDDLGIPRIGPMHQAGSDSLLTASVFFALRDRYFDGTIAEEGNSGVLHGIGEGDPARMFK